MENELEIKRVPLWAQNSWRPVIPRPDLAGVRWMCDGIGLSKGQMQNERTRIHNDKVLSQGERNLVLPTRGGNQETLCLKLDFVPLWLAKISITPSMEAETPELADRLEQYQLRAKDTLAEAFLPAAANPNFTSLSPELQMFKAIFDSVAKTELKQKEQDKAIEAVNQKVDGIRDVVVLNPNSWREECRRLLAKVAQARGGGGAYQESTLRCSSSWMNGRASHWKQG